MELRMTDKMRRYSKIRRRAFILYHDFGNTQCCIGCHLDRSKVPCWKSQHSELRRAITRRVIPCSVESLGRDINDICDLLPKIPLVGVVSPIEITQLVNTYSEEKIGVRVVWGKFVLRLGIQETNLVQGHPNVLYKVQDALGVAKSLGGLSFR